MQRYEPGHAYTDGYGVTARFLRWIDETRSAGVTEALNTALRAEPYDEAVWMNLAGAPLDTLWSEYAADAPNHLPVWFD